MAHPEYPEEIGSRTWIKRSEFDQPDYSRSNTTEDPHSITAQLNLVDEEIAALSKTVDELFDKMMPVLNPPKPTPTDSRYEPTEGSNDDYSSLAWTLRSFSDRIYTATDRVSELKRRLAI